MGLNGPEERSQAISPAITRTPLPSCLYLFPGSKGERVQSCAPTAAAIERQVDTQGQLNGR